MELALKSVADDKFGRDGYYIDKKQRSIPDHLHWHARPIDWISRDIYLADQQDVDPN